MIQEAELKQLLERKGTFERGCRVLAAEFSQTNSSQLMPLVSRAYTLLKTRHTNPEFWKAGLQLFASCQQHALAPEHCVKITTYLKDTREHLQAADIAEPEESPEDLTGQHPMDLLLGLGNQVAAASHFDDAGLIVDDASRWARAQQSGTPHAAAATATTATDAATSEETVEQTASGLPPAGMEAARSAAAASRQELQRQILEGIQAVYDGMAAVTRGTEAIERELDAVLSAIQDRRGSGARPVPPMSKRLLDSLPVLELDNSKLVELGEDSRCAVCTDTLQLGDKVFSLPCRGMHWFHPACVRPWLITTNSCPVCRHELPTDDPHYEAHKEKEQEAAQERAGVANALSHNEFMYI